MRDQIDQFLENPTQEPSTRSCVCEETETEKFRRDFAQSAVMQLHSLSEPPPPPSEAYRNDCFFPSSFRVTHGIILLVGSVKFYLFSDLTRQNNETPGVATWLRRGSDKPAHPRSARRAGGNGTFIHLFLRQAIDTPLQHLSGRR